LRLLSGCSLAFKLILFNASATAYVDLTNLAELFVKVQAGAPALL